MKFNFFLKRYHINIFKIGYIYNNFKCNLLFRSGQIMCGFFGYISIKPLDTNLKIKLSKVDKFLNQRGPDFSNFI